MQSRGHVQSGRGRGVCKKRPASCFVPRQVGAGQHGGFGPLLLALVLGYGPSTAFAPALLGMPLLVGLQFVLSMLLGYALAILAAAVRTHFRGSWRSCCRLAFS